MIIEKLRIANFRNHAETALQFSPEFNLFTGPNGQGKTNILEAIAYLSLGKSFFSVSDTNLVRRGIEKFALSGSYKVDGTVNYMVGISYDWKSKKKEVKINGKDHGNISDLIGKLPVVLLHPEQHGIMIGGPAERRRFLDIVLSQANVNYFETLLEFRRVLKQRNALLAENRTRGRNLSEYLEPWDEPYIKCSAKIMTQRRIFVKDFEGYLVNNYLNIIDRNETPGMEYLPSVMLDHGIKDSEIGDRVREVVKSSIDQEIKYKTTLYGPHRDELLFTINGMESRKFASQGQQKSFLVALKVSESQYLLKHRNEQPIILLDDLFGELDSDRAYKVLKLTTGMGQTFVTSTDDTITGVRNPVMNGISRFKVNNGVVVNA